MDKRNNGQTFVEFLLVLVVLLAATSGIWTMYKASWKKRYEKTAAISGAGNTIVNVSGVVDRNYVK